ncbi:right-handed parallel beta-helix repeat-containing protein [Paenibacillus aurantius]|uniref:Right-handed parallel beta-helix repeat-containing protein n=1 Tax=Paenibacillus aurantius TaxID=2918900 RepID=A0AA96REH5_9BACL|nr:LamG-like jellyroll fold domain-containing protein [Paenibacillus aurantius]WNQ10887.1 right-handed parallel beta-helix repeat-containing protein [Paenibacillus aurantius]
MKGKKRMSIAATLLLITGMIGSFGMVQPEIAQAAPTVYYASPTGSGSTCSQASPCSLTGVQAKVRTVSASMSDDIIVNLLGGTYTLSQTLVFSPSQGDSGKNGHNIIYQANNYGTPSQEVPVLSGGQSITGWTLHDSANNIWKANVGSLETRQLYVDGVRAYRARTNSGIPGTVTKTSTGYTTTDLSLQTWANAADIEMVYHDGDGVGNWLWAEPRCPVASITGNASSTTITMAQPCFDLTKSARGGNLSLPTQIENHYKALTQSGQFYLDRAAAGAHVLYYKPRAGQNLATASVIAPRLEQLVRGDGTLTAPIHHIQFKGLTFAYGTWLGPNSSQGFPETSYNKYNNTTGPESQELAAVSFYAGQNLLFEGTTFKYLGGAGLTLDEGSRFNSVVGSEFLDISGNGIQIGNVVTTYPSAAQLVTGNEVKNNYIHDIGKEYPGAYGIWNAITQNTTVEHNVIAHLPRGGIATNYQYSNQPPSATTGNRFNYNKVFDYMNNIRDGGGFDTNGTQNGISGVEPNSTLIGNVFYDNHNNFGQIYLDIWTAGFTVKNNVAYASASLDYNTIDFWSQPCCNVIRHNFFDQDNSYKFQTASDMALGNVMNLPVSAMPASIINNAGLEPAYRHLLPPVTPPSDTQAPSAPGGVSVSAVGAGPSVTVSWGSSSDNVGVTGYEVDNGSTVLAATTGLSAVVQGLVPGSTYHLVVRARDAAGNLSGPSSEVLVTVPGTADLVGHWTMDNGSGTAVSDYSGSFNNGSLSGAAWTTGKIGGGLSFSGAGSVNVGNAQILNQDRNSFTLATWFKSTSTGSGQRMISKGHSSNTGGYFMWNNAGKIALGVGANSEAANATVVETPGGFNDGNWHHAAAVVDRRAQTVQIYVDGTPRTLTKFSGFCGTVNGTAMDISGCPFMVASSNDPFTIGSYNGGAEYYNGSLDDVRVYSRALSTSEISDVMSLTGRWKLDEGGGTSAEDDTNNRTAPASVSNAAWVGDGGKIGGRLDFNGVNSYVSMGGAGQANMGTGSFSVGLWFKTLSTGIHQRMITKGNWGNTAGYFLWHEAGKVVFSLGSNGVQGNTVLVATPGGFNDGQWHQATAVVDRAAQTIKLYIDGTARTLASGNGYCGTASGTTLNLSGCNSLNATSGDSLMLGSYNGTNEFFSGSLDEVRLYNRALTDAEVTKLSSFNGLVGQWKFEEGNTPAAAEASGNSSAAALLDTDWTAGKFGKALSFNGVKSYSVMSRPDALNMGTRSFSLAAWFRTDSTGTHKRMVSKGNWGNSNGYFLWYEGGQVSFGLGAGGSQAGAALVGTAGGYGDDNWHHVAAVVDRTAQTLQIYVDGTAQTLYPASGYCGTATGTTLNIAACTSLNGTSADPFTLGGHKGVYELFTGSLDDVRVYSRALTQTDINSILLGN